MNKEYRMIHHALVGSLFFQFNTLMKVTGTSYTGHRNSIEIYAESMNRGNKLVYKESYDIPNGLEKAFIAELKKKFVSHNKLVKILFL